ncbi:hypothetical protein [Hydrogenophaga sp.]|uniref:hypothetical protein n=1 Tax=Hydrogenophaga sp. TaxID=1904254 RepID=UPI002735665F|nr:hypothetical protein [Hydrogenophaga sp.]MDP3885486.1 hypothetical protein [Hydrogenophaga sp.]
MIDLKRYFSNLRNRPEAEPSDFKSDNLAAADVMRRNIPVEKTEGPAVWRCLAGGQTLDSRASLCRAFGG